jgi:hypothetical protein
MLCFTPNNSFTWLNTLGPCTHRHARAWCRDGAGTRRSQTALLRRYVFPCCGAVHLPLFIAEEAYRAESECIAHVHVTNADHLASRNEKFAGTMHYLDSVQRRAQEQFCGALLVLLCHKI